MENIRKSKKILALATTLALSFATVSSLPKETRDFEVTAATGGYDYGKAFEMSMFFYQVQQAGPIADWNEVSWRADATMNDEVLGGWYDAGDHVKFNLPMAYSATTLNWGLIEYGAGLSADMKKSMELNVQFAMDYLVECDRGDEIVYQIGNGMADHKWWGSPEIIEYEMTRPTYTAKNASCVQGEMAAALASGYIAMKDDYPDKAAVYLEKAIHYFEMADTNRSDADYTEANDFYKSWSGFYDELFFASNWLYMATGDQAYLDKAGTYISFLGEENQVEGQKSISWPYCWDDVSQGAYLLYAINTGEEKWVTHVKQHMSWMQGLPVTMTNGGTKTGAAKLADGLSILGDNWATIRYANNGAFIANVAMDNLDLGSDFESAAATWAKKQTDYALGDNADNFSYVIGYGDDYPQHPHHRAAYGDWLDSNGKNDFVSENGYSHILYGAVVGGPNSSGVYADTQDDYQANEVATDYNAAYTANLMKLYGEYGGTEDPTFPPTETPNRPEFYIRTMVQQDADNFTGFKLRGGNHSAWPARVLQSPTFRYYCDLSEVFAAGYTVDDVFTQIDYERYGSGEDSNGLAVSPVQISEHPVQWDGDIYYVELSYPNSPSVMAPMGQEQHECEVQFRFGLSDDLKPPAGSWDKSNDWSYDGVGGTGEDINIAPNVCMYDIIDGNYVLISGVEPDGTVPGENDDKDPIITTTKPVTTTATVSSKNPDTTTSSSSTATVSSDNDDTSDIAYGDVDLDGKTAEITDVVLLGKHLSSKLVLPSSSVNFKNANCYLKGNDGVAVNIDDLKTIIDKMLGVSITLPVK